MSANHVTDRIQFHCADIDGIDLEYLVANPQPLSLCTVAIDHPGNDYFPVGNSNRHSNASVLATRKQVYFPAVLLVHVYGIGIERCEHGINPLSHQQLRRYGVDIIIDNILVDGTEQIDASPYLKETLTVLNRDKADASPDQKYCKYHKNSTAHFFPPPHFLFCL